MTAKHNDDKQASMDTAWMTKFWKDTYFQSLDVALKTQEEAERMVKEAISQGFSLQHDWLKWSKQCAESWGHTSNSIAGAPPNPFAPWTRQATDAATSGAETALKVSEETVKSGFALYETTIAAPMRKQARDVSTRLFETVVPD